MNPPPDPAAICIFSSMGRTICPMGDAKNRCGTSRIHCGTPRESRNPSRAASLEKLLQLFCSKSYAVPRYFPAFCRAHHASNCCCVTVVLPIDSIRIGCMPRAARNCSGSSAAMPLDMLLPKKYSFPKTRMPVWGIMSIVYWGPRNCADKERAIPCDKS